MDRQHHLHQVLPIFQEQVPINRSCKSAVDIFVADVLIRPIHSYLVPIAHSRHQLNTQQMGQAKYNFILYTLHHILSKLTELLPEDAFNGDV